MKHSAPDATQTQMRGWDEYEDIDYQVGSPNPFYPRVFARMPTERELKSRPFVRDPLQTVRCWCGRPIKDSTGQCLQTHEPPGS
jgi:hypothetical protein